MTNDASMLLAHDAEGRPIHLGREELLRHAFVVGATGSGKTNQLMAMAASAVSGGGGLTFVDGKGDLEAYRRIAGLARRYGREGDLRLLNFCDRPGSAGAPISNTFNPFGTGSAETLTQFVVGMMEEAGGDGAMWKGRATAMFTGVMKALVHLRDDGLLDLNVGAVRDHLDLKKIVDLSDGEKYPQVPEDVRRSVRSYLTSLPGYREEKKYKQAQTTLDQHGYLEMQFTKVLGSLADAYGHVFRAPLGEVDVDDLREGRRILVVLLPMVGRSAEERGFLGGVVQALLGGLTSPAAGQGRAPGDGRPPHLVMLDEFSAFATPGMEVLVSQARSLGFSFVFSTQTLVPPAHDRQGHMLDVVLANTATKILMRTDLVDRERFGRILPSRVALAREDALSAMKDRMETIRGLVSMRSALGEGGDVKPLAAEYQALAERQAEALARRLDVPDAADLQALPTGAMVVIQGGGARRALAYDLTLLDGPGPRIVRHLPVTDADIDREVDDTLSDLRDESGDPPGAEEDILDLCGGRLAALAMLPPPDARAAGADLARLSVAICAAAGQE